MWNDLASSGEVRCQVNSVIRPFTSCTLQRHRRHLQQRPQRRHLQQFLRLLHGPWFGPTGVATKRTDGSSIYIGKIWAQQSQEYCIISFLVVILSCLLVVFFPSLLLHFVTSSCCSSLFAVGYWDSEAIAGPAAAGFYQLPHIWKRGGKYIEQQTK